MRIYKAFTLVELLVVIVITSVLAAAVLIYLGETKPVARDARRKSDLQTIKQALEKEEFDTGVLSTNSNDRSTDCGDNAWHPVANCGPGSHLFAWNNNFIPKTYMAAVPIDPANRQYKRIVFANNGVKASQMRCMYYRFSSDGFVAVEDKFSYKLSALMESDWQAPGSDNGTGLGANKSYEVFVGTFAQKNRYTALMIFASPAIQPPQCL